MRLLWLYCHGSTYYGLTYYDLVGPATTFITALARSLSWLYSPCQAVQRAIQSNARPIRIPAYMTDRIVAIRRTRALAYYATGTDPAEEEIAGELQLSSSKVRSK